METSTVNGFLVAIRLKKITCIKADDRFRSFI